MYLTTKPWWKQQPLLTPEEEQSLFTELASTSSTSKRKYITNKITQCYGRLVISIAYKMKARAIILPDLIQEGFVGLYKATTKFNPKIGVRFGLFASLYIKYEMLHFLNYRSNLKKITTSCELEMSNVIKLPTNVAVEEIDQANKQNLLKHALSLLDARSASIVKGRWMSDIKIPRKEFAKQYGVSIEAIRKIEIKALKTLQAILYHLSIKE